MKRYGPDSLHSWFIAVYCSLISFLLYGVVRLSGVLFVASMSWFQVDRRHASLPYILCDGLQAMAGPLAGFFSVKFGTRPIVLAGSLIAAVGTGACFFAGNISTVTVLWGIVYGFGFGLSSLLLPVIVTRHFLTKRATAIGVVYFGTYAGFCILPSIADFLIQAYGLSGTFLWLSGFLLHCVPLSMLLSEPKFDAKLIPDMAEPKYDRMSFINGRRASFLMDPKDTSNSAIRHNSIHSIRKPIIYIKETLDNVDKSIIPISFRKLSENGTENHWRERTLIQCSRPIINNNILFEMQIKDRRTELKDTISASRPGLQNYAFVPENMPAAEESLDLHVPLSLQKEENCFHSEDNPKSDPVKFSAERNHSYDNENIKKQRLKGYLIGENPLKENNFNYEDGVTSIAKYKNLESEDESVKKELDHHLYEDILCKSVCAPKVNENSSKLQGVTDIICLNGVESHLKESVIQLSTVRMKSNECNESLPTCMKTWKGFSGNKTSSCFDDSQQRSFANTKPSKENWTARDALKIFLEPIFLLVLFSAAVFFSNFIIFITVIVDFTKDLGLQESDGKYVIMSLAVASNVGLVSFGWVTDGGHMTLTNFSGLMFLLRTITLILVPYSTGFGSLMGIVFVQGFCESSLGNMFPLIVADYYTEDIHELAISCTLFMSGPAYLATPSLIGYFRDGLGSYLYLFWLMAIMSLTCSILLFLAPILAKCRCDGDDRILRKINT